MDQHPPADRPARSAKFQLEARATYLQTLALCFCRVAAEIDIFQPEIER